MRGAGAEPGFTLVELMVVVVFIATLVAIGAVSYQSATTYARATSCVANQREIKAALAKWPGLHDGLSFVRPEDGFGTGEVVLTHDGAVLGDPTRVLSDRKRIYRCPRAAPGAGFSYVTDGQVVHCLHDGAVGLRADGEPFSVDVAVLDRLTHGDPATMLRRCKDETVSLASFGSGLTGWRTIGWQGADWEVVDGVARQTKRTWGFLSSGDEGWTDYTFHASYRTAQAGPSFVWETGRLAFRVQDEENYYAVLLKTDGCLELAKRQGGEWKPWLASAETSAQASDWNDFEIEVKGDRIRVDMGGANLIAWTDPDPIPSGGVGLIDDNSIGEFRDIKVER